MRVTLADVAREAGVSVATASRVLNGSTRPVREDFRLKVLASAQKLDYRADLAAQAMARGSTMTVAVVVTDIRDRYSAAIARGVVAGAAATDFVVTIAGGEPDAEDQLSVVTELRGQRPAGIILAGSRFHAPSIRDRVIAVLTEYRNSGGRVAVIGPAELPFPTVTFEYREGGARLARELVGLGYRSPLIAATRERSSSLVLDGVLEGFAAEGVDVPTSRILVAEAGREGGHALVGTTRDSVFDSVDVVVCTDDAVGIGVLTGLRERGTGPATGTAVTGFYDLLGSDDVWPALTTVRAPLAEAGAAALGLALGGGEVTRLATEVVVRGSTPRRPPTMD